MAGLQAAAMRSRLTTFRHEFQDNVWVRRAAILLIAAIAFVYPILDSSDVRIDTADLAEIYVLLALGLNIVVGFAGLLDLGYAAFFAIGAATTGFFASAHFPVGSHSWTLGIKNFTLLVVGPGGIHLDFWILIPLAAVIAALFGIAFGAPTLRLRGDYLAIVTLGFGEIVPRVWNNLGQANGLVLGRHGTLTVPNITNGVDNITGIDSPPDINFLWIHWTFQTNDPRPWYFLGFIVICVSVVIITRLRSSRLGRCWVAIREDEVAAAHAGVNITGARLTAFALGAAFSGFGGVLFAAKLASVSSVSFLFQVSVLILVMVILGGIGSIPGVMVGGIIIAYLSQTWLDQAAIFLNNLGSKGTGLGFLGHIPALKGGPGPIGSFGSWLATAPFNTAKPLILGIILVGMMLTRPQGLWPQRQRARELHPETSMELAEEQEELYTVRTGEI